MPKVIVSLYGRDYQLACPEGQERRVQELAHYVEQRMHDVAGSIGNTTETRLFMLTCMMLADEVLDLRENRRQAPTHPAVSAANEEEMLLKVIARMQDRLDHLTTAAGNA